MAIYFGQTITEKLSQAETYFGATNHMRTYDWAAYADDEKKAALNQSEREINSHLGLLLEDNYSNTEFPIEGAPSFRPDYAVMEHAFFLLNNVARTKTAAGGAEMIESEDYQEQEHTDGLGIAPEAIVFLRVNRIQVERG